MGKRNILLLEPNYKNKYPPIGLMKLATYHRKLGDNVVFYKGDLKQFVLEDICCQLIEKISKIDNTVNWNVFRNDIIQFIYKGIRSIKHTLISKSQYA
ncbi:MAG: hypothetical protein ACOCUT_02735, partial [bacterium]